jgi:putative peptidoglycan lipid II flippase
MSTCDAVGGSGKSDSNRSLGRSMLTVSSMTFCSRIFGLLRDIAMAWYWGGTVDTQAAFQVAFAFPNSLRTLFGEGAFNQAFVPILAESLEKQGREKAWLLAERAISLQLTALLVCVLAVSGISLGCLAFSPPDTAPRVRMTLLILPVLMPYAMFICLTGAFSSILNCLKKFLLPALTPILFNVVQISSVLLLSLLWYHDEFAALLFFSLSAILAGLLQLLTVMVAARRQGFVFHFNPTWNCPEVKLLCINILPGLVGAGVMQLNSLVDRILGLWLGSAAVGALNYSQHLVYLPVGIFGVAMGVVCLPSMSRAWALRQEEEMVSSLNYALRIVLFLSLPCATLLGALSTETISMLFARGAFTSEAVRECSWTLNFYLVGLPAFCCAKVATNPFHARKDTRTPVKIAMICMVLNLVLNLILMQFLRQGGLALSTSICSWLNVTLLLTCNRRMLPAWKPGPVLKAAFGLGVMAMIAGLVAGLTGYAMQKSMANMPALPSILKNLFCVLGGGLAGGITYLLATRLAARPEPSELLHALLKR